MRALTLAILLAAVTAPATTLPDAAAVRAIVGEARGESFAGQVAVACALRNRGTLAGVFGYQAPVPREQLLAAWPAAVAAWRQSADRDVTGGATHWATVSVRPWWARSMRRTLVVGRHSFYARNKSTR